MVPLIGITMSYDSEEKPSISMKYCEAVEKAGGLPLAIPAVDETSLDLIARKLDGIILSGGPDIDPSYYNQAPHPKLGQICPDRDRAEIFLAKKMINSNKPVLGICRGLQVINVSMGGSLYQDVSSQVDGCIKHRQDAPRWHKSHEVQIINESSLTYKVLGQKRIMVNSFHHQAVDKVAPGCEITALSQDNVVEAIELKGKESFCLGVQWHPEELIEDPVHLRLFQAMIDVAKKRMKDR